MRRTETFLKKFLGFTVYIFLKALTDLIALLPPFPHNGNTTGKGIAMHFPQATAFPAFSEGIALQCREERIASARPVGVPVRVSQIDAYGIRIGGARTESMSSRVLYFQSKNVSLLLRSFIIFVL